MASAKVAPFMIYSGTEELDLDRQIAKAQATKNRAVTLLDGDGLHSSEIVAACEEHSILDDRNRLVLVDNAERVKSPDALLEYIKEKNSGDLSVILAAFLRPVKRANKAPEVKIPDVWNKAISKGISKSFDKPKPWETKAKFTRINFEAELLDCRLAKGVDEVILSLVGDDLYVICNELRKLSLLVGPGGTVTKEHVLLVVASQPPSNPFEIADATAEKNVKRAMNLLAHFYRYEGEEASVQIASALMRNVERLLVARSLLDAGKSKDEIATQMGMNPFRLQNTFLLWANRHSVKSLSKNLATLCRLDANVKGPSRSKRTQVELAVLSIAS